LTYLVIGSRSLQLIFMVPSNEHSKCVNWIRRDLIGRRLRVVTSTHHSQHASSGEFPRIIEVRPTGADAIADFR